MPTVKTAISVEATLFEEVEQVAHEMNVSRSRIFAMAMEEYLHRRNNLLMLRELDEAYATGPDDDEAAVLRQMRRQHRRSSEEEW